MSRDPKQSSAATAGLAMKSVEFRIMRFNPEVDEKPYLQHYTLEMPADKDMMVLKALVELKEQDPTLSFRRSCGEGVCGSDGMNINGKNGLACITPISSLKAPITLRPLPAFPIIRDLIVDMKQFFDQYEKAKPYLMNDEPPPAKERLQSPEQRAKLDGLYECILCGCCTSSCPSYWWNPEKYMGPAALLQAYRFIADSRDTADRIKELEDPFSLFRCRGVMNCADVCPKGLNPREAISGITAQMIQEST
jgi:succinate dehydrogenase / fumarate reductase iron-sulfur subunit